jgi:hypothetical protein
MGSCFSFRGNINDEKWGISLFDDSQNLEELRQEVEQAETISVFLIPGIFVSLCTKMAVFRSAIT